MTTAQTTRAGYQDYYVLEDYGMTPAEVQARHDAACELIHNLQADRDRLRAALAEIMTICNESAADCRKRMGTRIGNTLVVARAALAQSEKGE